MPRFARNDSPGCRDALLAMTYGVRAADDIGDDVVGRRGSVHRLSSVSRCSSSSGATLAVPSLPTTTPAAALASLAASGRGAPAAEARARTLSTVSPAPVTSKTWRPLEL